MSCASCVGDLEVSKVPTMHLSLCLFNSNSTSGVLYRAIAQPTLEAFENNTRRVVHEENERQHPVHCSFEPCVEPKGTEAHLLSVNHSNRHGPMQPMFRAVIALTKDTIDTRHDAAGILLACLIVKGRKLNLLQQVVLLKVHQIEFCASAFAKM